ncbi:MAG: hypothetical protein J0I20_06900 [Chloroflexi bacterium]|nr:hypothetical protein [Chloroflexota bacterium]OJV95157.1 MAG: hypothetical protein BGO39_24395 [Chloroflexi bacterium 54-19]
MDIPIALVLEPDFRPNLSYSFLQSAAYFSRMSHKIEIEVTDRSLQLVEYKANSTAAVIFAITAVEAVINELYTDAVDGIKEAFKNLDPLVSDSMALVWNDFKDKENFFLKFNFVLTLAKKPTFVKGSNPGQDMLTLVSLRNNLIHFKPEWKSTQDEHKKLEDRLRGKFELNPYAPDYRPFFPDKCLGHGCAEWAVKTSIAFLDEFYIRLGKRKYTNFWSADSKLLKTQWV